MHAFCLISAAGTSKPRSRAPHEMDLPPTFKTRRSNAVHTRRLALRVSSLDRHLASLETQRARDVRQLHEELLQLKGPPSTLSPVSSPRRRDVAARPVRQRLESGAVASGHDGSGVCGDPALLSGLPQQPPDVRQGPISVSDFKHGPLSVSDIKHGPLSVSDIKHGPLSVSDIKHGPLSVSDVKNGPLSVSDIKNGPLSIADVKHGPLSVSDVKHGPLSVSDVKHGPLSVSDVKHGPLSVSDELQIPSPQQQDPISRDRRDESTTETKQQLSFLRTLALVRPDGKGKLSLRKAHRDGSSVAYTVGELSKQSAVPRTSRSLPPAGYARRAGQEQDHGGVKDGTQPGKERRHPHHTEDCSPASHQHGDHTGEWEIATCPDAVSPVTGGRVGRVPPATPTLLAQGPGYSPLDTDQSSPTFTATTVPALPAIPREPGPEAKASSSRSLQLCSHNPCHLASTRRSLRSSSPGHNPCHLASSCNHFPCAKPPTYHSLGFHPDPSSRSWRGWMAQNARRPHHRLAPGRHPPAGPDGRKTPADAPGYGRRQRLGREEVMRMDMARKKVAHALARPPSWNTNYGQPTPYKRLNYVARLKPLL